MLNDVGLHDVAQKIDDIIAKIAEYNKNTISMDNQPKETELVIFEKSIEQDSVIFMLLCLLRKYDIRPTKKLESQIKDLIDFAEDGVDFYENNELLY